jgi:hypothetical protein
VGAIQATPCGLTKTVKTIVGMPARSWTCPQNSSSLPLVQLSTVTTPCLPPVPHPASRLGLDALEEASLLCTCVTNHDLRLLRRLLHAGANANAGNFDRRTALREWQAAVKGLCCGLMGGLGDCMPWAQCLVCAGGRSQGHHAPCVVILKAGRGGYSESVLACWI